MTDPLVTLERIAADAPDDVALTARLLAEGAALGALVNRLLADNARLRERLSEAEDNLSWYHRLPGRR